MLNFDIIQINNNKRLSTKGQFEGNHKTIVIKTKDYALRKYFKEIIEEGRNVNYISFESENRETDFQFNVKMQALHMGIDMKGNIKILLGKKVSKSK
ncbi:hypothetical protein SAMN05421743_105229 [Thalassobacillus cyri]|uniref:Uncharacterized protein n=1 Tax=Thalassobacillus cyri TaxID=571932 RepID=A0A1H4C1A6_9BACI|nr:hypothetical protein [Thalassobacillus cyri]SEA54211.1 hypothetical protein SAMN05421743_105229 [Thalassobacillus cyri]